MIFFLYFFHSYQILICFKGINIFHSFPSLGIPPGLFVYTCYIGRLCRNCIRFVFPRSASCCTTSSSVLRLGWGISRVRKWKSCVGQPENIQYIQIFNSLPEGKNHVREFIFSTWTTNIRHKYPHWFVQDGAWESYRTHTVFWYELRGSMGPQTMEVLRANNVNACTIVAHVNKLAESFVLKHKRLQCIVHVYYVRNTFIVCLGQAEEIELLYFVVIPVVRLAQKLKLMNGIGIEITKGAVGLWMWMVAYNTAQRIHNMHNRVGETTTIFVLWTKD